MALPRGFAILLTLSLLVAAGTGAATFVDRPSWTKGDFWTYRTNTTLTPGLNLTGTATSTVAGTQATLTGGTSVEAFRVIVIGSGTAAGRVTTPNGTVSVLGSWSLTGEERFEPDNLHSIYSLLDLSVNGTYGYVIPIPFSLRFQNTTTYRIVSDGWRYPMVVGTSGNVTVAYNFTQDLYSPTGGHLHENGTGQSILGFSLADAVSVDTPAGAFQAYALREDAPDGTWQRAFFAPTVGNDVRTESHDRDGTLTALGTLVAYRYQAAEAQTFLGLTLVQWIFAATAIAAVAVVVGFLIRRSRHRKTPVPPADDGDAESTSGPRGP